MIDKSFKYFKWFFYFLLIISMIFSLIDRVNAADYNLYGGSIQPRLCRAWYSSGSLDSTYSNGQCNFQTSIASIKQIGIFFDTKTYYGYKNHFYEFSGSLQSFGANVVVVNSYIANGSNTLIGSCDTTLNSTGQMTTFTSRCFIPSGLNSGSNSNIFFLYVADSGVTPSSSFNVEITLNDRYVLFENYYYDKNGSNNNVINAINNQSQQQHQDSINTQNKLNDINNTMNNGLIDNPSSNTSSWGNMNASNGVITNLLTLPIQLMQGYVNGLNSSCTPFNLGNLFGTNITLPCINIGNLIGSSLWGVIDVLFSGFMIFGIAKKLIKIFNDFTNMKGDQVDELYGGGA